ncbi:MAG: hypothetical protein HY537_15525 [Deltaproteobacteria bacterium]|nr:hypothetical protein [Deltaproteobacteria bacterium]
MPGKKDFLQIKTLIQWGMKGLLILLTNMGSSAVGVPGSTLDKAEGIRVDFPGFVEESIVLTKSDVKLIGFFLNGNLISQRQIAEKDDLQIRKALIEVIKQLPLKGHCSYPVTVNWLLNGTNNRLTLCETKRKLSSMSGWRKYVSRFGR